MICLDSTLVIDFLDPDQNHHEAARRYLSDHSDEELCTPSICAFEVLRGATRAGDSQFDRTRGFFETIEVLDLTLAAAVAAGDFDGVLHETGRPLSARDTLVASQARSVDATVATRDRDFQGIPRLDVDLFA